VRRRLALRQRDLAERAGVSQQTVSNIELGRLEEVDLGTLRRVCAALGIEISVTPRWRGPDLDRLLDAGHAAIVEEVVRGFRAGGWTTEVEWSFNRFGERGSIDVLAWHPVHAAVAIVEVKTRIVDLQDLLATLDRKVRIAREVLPGERGWRPASMARILVVPATSTSRDAVDRHEATFTATLPGRTVETRRWLKAPIGDLRSIWFVRGTSPGGAPFVGPAAGQRVRPQPRSSALAKERNTTLGGATSG
jgi:transcriptional regulator with XRE-family HTH domain